MQTAPLANISATRRLRTRARTPAPARTDDARTHARTHARTDLRTHARTYAHECTHASIIRINTHTHTHACTRARVHTHTHTHPHTHTHTHTHARTHATHTRTRTRSGRDHLPPPVAGSDPRRLRLPRGRRYGDSAIPRKAATAYWQYRAAIPSAATRSAVPHRAKAATRQHRTYRQYIAQHRIYWQPTGSISLSAMYYSHSSRYSHGSRRCSAARKQTRGSTALTGSTSYPHSRRRYLGPPRGRRCRTAQSAPGSTALSA